MKPRYMRVRCRKCGREWSRDVAATGRVVCMGGYALDPCPGHVERVVPWSTLEYAPPSGPRTATDSKSA